MVDKAEKIYADSKKSLESLLREKAYTEVQKNLEAKGIDIETVSDTDVENLVAAKTQDIKNGLKGFGVGTVFAMAISLFIGV